MTILPVDELPLEVEIWRESNEVQHLVRIGLVDERWDSLSESKRWKAVYFYATEGRDIDWTWSEPISGQMSGE
ncbi:MAG TPA: hypothetical protein VHO25_22525 [Polyangiaceae bacterium]|nr:hypothetical protein [Polyangiaceae bacterium]